MTRLMIEVRHLSIRSGYALIGKCAAVSIIGLCIFPNPVLGQSLDEVLGYVYQNNPTINGQRVQLRETNENYPQAISNWLPNVEYSRTDTNTVSREKNADTGTTNSDQVDHALSVSADLFRGGRNFAALRKARKDISAAREELLNTEQTVFLAAITAYMDTLRDRRRVEIRENNVERLQKHMDAVKVQFDLRRRTRADVAQAETRLLAAQAELATDRAALVATQERYERIVGMPPGELSIPKAPKDMKITDENARELIANNPSIKRQRLLVGSAEEDVDLVAGELLPSFSISSSVTRSKNANRNASATVGRTGTVAMTLTVPLYQKGAVYSRLRASKYALGRQKLTLNETYRTSMENLIGNDERVEAARIRLGTLEKQVAAANIALESISAELEVGRRTVLDLLDQEQELLNGQLNLVSAQRDYVVFAFTVERDVGALTADDLGLSVELYQPEEEFQQQRYKLIGTGTLPSIIKQPDTFELPAPSANTN